MQANSTIEDAVADSDKNQHTTKTGEKATLKLHFVDLHCVRSRCVCVIVRVRFDFDTVRLQAKAL